jgi:endogenous inhibitor of DNA gyrase (YacG/DUF329 family)
MVGKCPYCGKNVMSLRIHRLDASEPLGVSWYAVTYNCPSCNSILGCEKDPIAVENDIADEVIRKIKGKK